MPKTIIEKIISNHSKQSVQAGDLTIIDVDATMATDSTAPLAIKSFKEMGGDQVADSDRIVLVIDHAPQLRMSAWLIFTSRCAILRMNNKSSFTMLVKAFVIN